MLYKIDPRLPSTAATLLFIINIFICIFALPDGEIPWKKNNEDTGIYKLDDAITRRTKKDDDAAATIDDPNRDTPTHIGDTKPTATNKQKQKGKGKEEKEKEKEEKEEKGKEHDATEDITSLLHRFTRQCREALVFIYDVGSPNLMKIIMIR